MTMCALKMKRRPIAWFMILGFCATTYFIVNRIVAILSIVSNSSHHLERSISTTKQHKLSQTQKENVCRDLGESENNIFIIETFTNFPQAKALATIESAARTHPEYCVNMLYIKERRNYSHYNMRKAHIIAFDKLVEAYGNIREMSMHLHEATKHTEIDKIVERVKEIPIGRFSTVHRGDAVRYALLYKYGGIYIDSDMIVLKNLNATRNYIMANGNTDGFPVPMNSFLKFERGAKFMELVMEESVKTYDPNQYAVLMFSLQSMTERLCFKGTPNITEESSPYYECQNKSAQNIVSLMGAGFGISTVMDTELLEESLAAMKRIQNESPRVVHMSYSYSKTHEMKIDLITSDATIAKLFRDNCPILREHFLHLYL